MKRGHLCWVGGFGGLGYKQREVHVPGKVRAREGFVVIGSHLSQSKNMLLALSLSYWALLFMFFVQLLSLLAMKLHMLVARNSCSLALLQTKPTAAVHNCQFCEE